MKGTVRGLAMAGISVGALVAATGCGGISSGLLTADHLNAATHAAVPAMARQAHAAPSAVPSPAVPSPVASSPDVGAAPSAAPSTAYHGPHFNSPESAMTYLAAAFNSGNAAALHEVTTPGSYDDLAQMRSEAVNLQLQYCTANAGRGDYYCYFSHDYPASLHQSGHGASTVLVAPAENPGWYMYTLVECG